MSARAMTPEERAGMNQEFLARTEAARFSPLAGPNQPLQLEVQPESGEERMWYALGYDGAQTFEAVPLPFRSFYDLGAADKKAGRSPRATWVQEKAVVQAPDGSQTAPAGPVPAPAISQPAAGPKPDSAPVWPLLLGGGALTVGIALLLTAKRRKRTRPNV